MYFFFFATTKHKRFTWNFGSMRRSSHGSAGNCELSSISSPSSSSTSASAVATPSVPLRGTAVLLLLLLLLLLLFVVPSSCAIESPLGAAPVVVAVDADVAAVVAVAVDEVVAACVVCAVAASDVVVCFGSAFFLRAVASRYSVARRERSASTSSSND